MPQSHQHNSPLSVAYARSLLELATAQNQAEAIGQELADIEKALESDRSFETFFSTPAVGEIERGRVIEKVFRGRVSTLLANFLGVVNRKGRLALLRQIASAYQ